MENKELLQEILDAISIKEEKKYSLVEEKKEYGVDISINRDGILIMTSSHFGSDTPDEINACYFDVLRQLCSYGITLLNKVEI